MNQGHKLNGPHYGLAVAGVMIAAAGLLVMLVLGHNYSTCQSFLGQLVPIAGGVVLAVVVLRLLSTGQQLPAPACQRCGQLLSAHVRGWCPPCARCGQPILSHVQSRCWVPPPAPSGGQGSPV